MVSPRDTFPLGWAHTCHCPWAVGADEQSCLCLDQPPALVGPGVWDSRTPYPTPNLWPGILARIGIPKPSPLAPNLSSASSPDPLKTHPSHLSAGSGEASGLGACGISLQRPYEVTSAVLQEVWQSLDSVFCLCPAEGPMGKGHVREDGPRALGEDARFLAWRLAWSQSPGCPRSLSHRGAHHAAGLWVTGCEAARDPSA